nr:unnamed protein product [Callosobruchus chinensis]
MRNSNDEENVEKNTMANEMDFYLKSNRLDRKADPYKWWSANEKQYPNLSKFAKVYLSSPGSSVYSKRHVAVVVEMGHRFIAFVYVEGYLNMPLCTEPYKRNKRPGYQAEMIQHRNHDH